MRTDGRRRRFDWVYRRVDDEGKVNHWLESTEVLSRLEEWTAAGEEAALATVVRIVGSAYRRPGAKLVVAPSVETPRGTLGGVSGGCLEGDVREVAARVLWSGEPRLLHYDTGGEEEVFGLGLGCRGQIDVFVQPASRGPLQALRERWRTRLAGDAPFVVATVVGGADGLGTMALVGANGEETTSGGPPALAPALVAAARERLASGERPGCAEIADHLVFFETMEPPLHLLVCGAGDDAMPLVERAAEVGFRVTVIDHRHGLLAAERFSRAAGIVHARPDAAELVLPSGGRSLAVVMTHSYGHDRDWTRRLLAHGVRYLGLLGPRARTAEIRRTIGAESDPRVFGPVGLDVGADGPRQVALSIVAELLAVVAQREPRHLSARSEAIHAG